MDAYEFAEVAARMQGQAHELGLRPVPSFSSPPREPGVLRSARLHEDGAIVFIVVDGRADADIIRDMALGTLYVTGRMITPDVRGDVWSEFDLDLLEAAARGET